MDFNVNVKITLEETPALINCFSTFIECLHKVVSTPVISSAPVVEFDIPLPEPEPVQAEAQAEVQAKHKYTVGEIQSACTPLMDTGRLDELADVLKKFGANTLFEVAEDHYDALVDELRALGVKL